MTLSGEFLGYSASKLRELTSRIETCLHELSEEQVWARGKESENAVGNLVLHLCGNVGQWIVSAVGHQPDHRLRDAEFAARGGAAKAELAARLRSTVDEALEVIGGLSEEQLAVPASIQGYDGSLFEEIYHRVEH